MSESPDENPTHVSDDRLPEDLVPGKDNPLAEPLPDGESAGDLLEEGKPADEASESGQAAGSGETGEAGGTGEAGDTSDTSQQG